MGNGKHRVMEALFGLFMVVTTLCLACFLDRVMVMEAIMDMDEAIGIITALIIVVEAIITVETTSTEPIPGPIVDLAGVKSPLALEVR